VIPWGRWHSRSRGKVTRVVWHGRSYRLIVYQRKPEQQEISAVLQVDTQAGLETVAKTRSVQGNTAMESHKNAIRWAEDYLLTDLERIVQAGKGAT
jgi:hypothetical protein